MEGRGEGRGGMTIPAACRGAVPAPWRTPYEGSGSGGTAGESYNAKYVPHRPARII